MKKKPILVWAKKSFATLFWQFLSEIFFPVISRCSKQSLNTFIMGKFLQVGHVGMETCTAKGMEQTLQLWAQPCSTMGWAVVLATRSCVWTTLDGACLAPFWSPPPISARQTTPYPTTQGGGVTLRSTTLTSPSLFSSTLLSTKLELSRCPTEGIYIYIYILTALLTMRFLIRFCLSIFISRGH